MALSTGQINDAFQQALGRFPTGDESQRIAARGDLEGSPGQQQLLAELGGSVSGNPADDLISAVRQSTLEFFKPFEEAAGRSKEFDEKNPFAFDEALAKASAQKRFDPFFDAELNEFITGVERQRSRTIQDEEKLRRELSITSDQFVGRAKRNLEETLRASREGFAGAGLFQSGRRTREEGLARIEEGESTGDFLRSQRLRGEESGLRQTRMGEDIDLKRKREERLLGARRETALRTDIETQRGEAQQQREFERQQFVGFPLATGTSSLQNLFGIS
jgi:hypothetical protein